MECKVTKKERFWLYRNHINIVASLLSIYFIVQICEFLFSFDSYCFPETIWLITDIIILRRFHIIYKLYYVRLDFRKLYELQKHKSKNNLYNTYWLMVISFYDGDFQKTIYYANTILNLTSYKSYIKYAAFYKTLSCFFTGNTVDTLNLIRNYPFHSKNTLYYKFIEAYIYEQYDEAISAMQTLLSKKKDKTKNIDKVLANYFMRMAYLKKGDSDNAQNCIVEILVADKKRNTYFSKNVRNVFNIK